MVVSFFWGGGRNFFEKLQSVNKMGRYKTEIRLFYDHPNELTKVLC